MTARHIFIDETKRRDYLMVAAAVLTEDLHSLRTVVQGVLLPGQHRLHMKNEGAGRQQTIAATIAETNLQATVYDAGHHYRTQIEARAACLRAVVQDLAAVDSDAFVLLEQDDTLVQSDRQILYHAVRAVGRADTVRYDHRHATAELLLGVPDAIAWCWAKGGHWRKRIRPVVTTVHSV